jgi:serine/threonine-protein kinase
MEFIEELNRMNQRMARNSRGGFEEGQKCGRYQLEHVLGKGGMAVVWKAWDPENQQHVAIKVIAERLFSDQHVSACFNDELRRHGRLNHPRIVRLLDTFSIYGQQCMVMSLIEGESLAALLERSPGHALPLQDALRIFTDILSALDYAHRNGILHRDVKPSNILLDAKQHAYLLDFGIAIAVGEARHTRAGVSVGTPEYMSPEQIRDPEHIDLRTDVYSAACVLYAMLTGQPPFVVSAEGNRTTAELALRAAHINQIPVPPHRRQPAIPLEVSKVIMVALDKNRDRRPQGCAEFLRLLHAAVPDGAEVKTKNTSEPSSLRLAPIALLVIAMGAIMYVFSL